jgi:hypothetical protein
VTLYFFAGLVVGLTFGAFIRGRLDRAAIRRARMDLKRHTDALIEAQSELSQPPEQGKGVDDGRRFP